VRDKRRRKTGRQPTAPVRRDAQGRAHLVIHHDEQGVPLRLVLSRPLFNQAWQNQVALSAADTAHGLLAAGHTPEQAVELGRSAMDGTSKIIDGLLRGAADRRLACRAGCAHCCHQQVGVSVPEVLAIYDHLRRTCARDDLEATVARIRDADDGTRGMTATERLSPDLPCPFLTDDRCSIYQVRPLACRGTNSLDEAACERNLRDPVARARFLAGEVSTPAYLEPIRAFHAVTAGLQLALDDLHGLEVAPLELTAAMRVLIDDPEGVPLRWLAGQDPFAAARGGDNSDDPRIRELIGRSDDGG
jgi:Fe-S-cluster containining protein